MAIRTIRLGVARAAVRYPRDCSGAVLSLEIWRVTRRTPAGDHHAARPTRCRNRKLPNNDRARVTVARLAQVAHRRGPQILAVWSAVRVMAGGAVTLAHRFVDDFGVTEVSFVALTTQRRSPRNQLVGVFRDALDTVARATTVRGNRGMHGGKGLDVLVTRHATHRVHRAGGTLAGGGRRHSDRDDHDSGK